MADQRNLERCGEGLGKLCTMESIRLCGVQEFICSSVSIYYALGPQR